MKKVLFFYAIMIAFIPITVKADVMNPEYLTKECPAGQEEVTCSFRSSEPFGPKTSDECVKYENNPNFEYRVGHGSSFGGASKYCFVGSGNPEDYENKPLETYNNYIIPTSVVALILLAGLSSIIYLRKRNRNHT